MFVSRQNWWIYQQLVEGVSHLRWAEHQDREAVPENTKNTHNHLKRKQGTKKYSIGGFKLVWPKSSPDNHLKCSDFSGKYLSKKQGLLSVSLKCDWSSIPTNSNNW